jgi:hypothetical protein
MPSEKHLSKTTFAEFSNRLILTEATNWVKIITIGCIEDCFILDEFEVVFEILCSLGVK